VPGRFQSYDIDGGPPTYNRIDGPFNGTFTGFDAPIGVFTYTPNLDYLGRDSVKFEVFDGAANSNIGTVRILMQDAVCDCPNGGDPNLDGSPDVLDVIHVIDVVFQAGPYLVIRPCRLPYEDMNCDCALDVFDVIFLINYVFNNGPSPCNLCEAVCP